MKREALFCVSTRVSLKSSAWQGFRNFAAKKKCHQKFWVRKNFGSEKNFQKNFRSEKRIWSEKNCGSEKILILGSKILIQNSFLELIKFLV